MTRPLNKTIVAVALLLATIFTANVSADTYGHIDGLAKRIERNSRKLVNEARHYRHTDQYSHLRSDAKDVQRLAKHIHQVAHQKGSVNHLAADLAVLDSTFHHLESVFDLVEIDAAHGHGHIHGGTAHVKELLNTIENDIHHLQADLELLRRPVFLSPRSTAYRTPPITVYRSYRSAGQQSHRHHDNHGHSGQGHSRAQFSIGGGSSKVTFRF